VRLTALSHGAGCACKIPPGVLHPLLEGLPRSDDPALLVGHELADDGAVYQVSDDLAIVTTVDFFTPIVDDPYDFGRVAAANALSDVYAMGGRPLTALNLVAYSLEQLGEEPLRAILRGGADVAASAGVAVVGGHSIDDAEPKYGMAVTGAVHPDKVLRNSTARPGDALYLTKPVGGGVASTAAKRELAPDGLVDATVEVMTTLNREASEAALAADTSAATDVTGFGLLGHLGNMLAASKVGAEIAFDALPVLPHALSLASRGIVPGGTQRNLAAAAEVEWAEDLTPVERIICVDAQTSGGLLLAVPPENRAALLAALEGAGTPAAAVIGRLTAGPVGHVRVARTLP
jgi:selenide, water dikinase